MNPSDQTPNNPDDTNLPDDSQSQDANESTPLDGMISTLDGWIKDPKSISQKDLEDMKSNLEDLKSFMDNEESTGSDNGGGSQDQGSSDGEKPSLVVAIGKAAHGGR